MATGSPNREFTSDELDAMAAAELPVQDAPIPPNASTAIAASGAPEQTGSPGLITGEGALPARGPAMGPVAQLEAREYSTEELDLLEQANKPQEFTTDELDLEAVAALEDPNYVPTRDEYFDQKATKERLKAQGKIPGNGELAAKAVGGLFVSAFDAFNSTLFSPVETLAKSTATLQTGIGRASIEAMNLGGWLNHLVQGDPTYRNDATGEFLFSDLRNPESFAEIQARFPDQPIRVTNPEDLKDYEFQRHLQEKGIDAEYQALGQKTAPTELLTRVLTGRNQQETPIESQAQVLEIATDPTNLIPFGAGAKTLGLSRGMKIVSAKTASGIEKLAGGLIKGNDILAERFARVVTEKTGVSPQNISAAANAMSFGRNVGIGGGIAMGATALGAPPEVSATIAGFYPAYKAGLGVLRKIETGAGASKIILRESADATNGLDQAARAAVLANPAVPSIFKEVLERPSQFVSIESTPARLAANQALSPQMRAFMGKLSNPAIVQAVRGSSALATGAAKGAAANVPFALLAANAGQDEDAAAMLAMGGTFGALGGGVDRFTGLQQRRQQAALSDVSRMLVDIELNAGDVGKMMSTQTPDNLVRLAAMQGTFRNGLDFVPLSAEDYDANVAAQGGAGTAGMFVQAPLGERAKVFINLDARRGGVEPHEFGHALLASGALDGQQKYAARAWVDKTYGPEGIQARAREYASNIIRGKNASAFPDGNFEISPGTLTAEMENLSQGGLARGDMDGLDWARDEIFAETFAKASNTMDFAAIRRGAPAGGNMLTFAESILAAQARALSASGVRIDPQTGEALDTPGSLFKENPLLGTDKALLTQLGTYINNYRQWANDPTHEKPRPNRIAPSGRASDIANNPQVTFYDRGDGVKATTFATQDPATGQAILRDQRDLNKEHAKVKEQIRNIVGSKLIPDSNPVLGPKKTADGRVTVRGRVLPPSFDFLNGFMPHIRAFARQFEALGAAGESMQVRYHAIGSGDTGAFRVNRLGNLEAITREVIPWGWELTKAGNLNATVLDLSQFRNRAMRGIAERNPALAPFDYDMGKIEADLKTYMENHRQELPGNTKIGDEKRDAINAILGIATTKNRERNALSGSFGPGSAIKQFRLDRVDAAVGTGRTGFHFDYDRANRNFMPDKPAPMPDLSRDVPTDKMQEVQETIPTPGKPFEFFSIRNKEKSPYFGSRFGQDIEPHGQYLTQSTPSDSANLDSRFEKGVVRFENPLVIDFGGEYGDPSNWKNVLSSQFGGKTGFELSQAIRNAGHDGIVTVDPSRGPNRPAQTSEIVDLRNISTKGQAMPDALEVEAFHGTPDGSFTEFQDSPNGIFFSNKRDVAEGYTYKRGAWLSKGKNPKVISSKLRMQNPLSIDAMGARYNNIPFPGREYKRTTFGNVPQDAISVEQATKLAFDAGHDGIVIKNVMDGSTSNDKTRSTVYAVRSPAQIIPSITGQAMPDAVPQFDSKAGAFVIDQGDDVSLPVYQQANRGKPAVDNKGEPKFVEVSYDLINAPRIAEYSGPGPEDVTKPDFKTFAYDITLKGQQQINAAIDSGAVDAAANSVVKFTQEVMQTPEIAAGMGWYSRMRENLLRVLGEDGREILSQLLGATSAKTPVDENFLQAMDAYEGIKAGRYDANRKAYLEMLAAEKKGQLTDIIGRRNYTGKVRTMADQLSKQARQLKGKKKAATLAEAAKLRDLVKKSPDEWTKKDRYAIMDAAIGIMPMRSNGKKFNANSMAVLKVISGKWLDNRDSPKTPNFAGNLSGRTVQATIDVWAARFLRETLYEGTGNPWRIQPKSETAVNNQDFALGQVIMARAAKKLDMNPDDLQAVLWFAEKHRWDKRGWTKNQGAEKSSFDTVFNVFFPKDGKPLTFAEASKIFKKSKK